MKIMISASEAMEKGIWIELIRLAADKKVTVGTTGVTHVIPTVIQSRRQPEALLRNF